MLFFIYICAVTHVLNSFMIAESFRNASPLLKIFFVFFAILIGFLVFMVLGLVIAIPAFGIELSALEQAFDPSKTENIGLLKFLQSMYSIGLFAFPPVIVAWFFSGRVWNYLKLNIRPNLLLIVLSGIIVFTAIPFINFFAEMNANIHFPEWMSGFENLMKQLEGDAQRVTKSFLVTDSFSVYLVNILVIAIIPAIGEELLFRGIFQRLFHEWSKNIHVAIWVAAFFFSAMHMQFYGILPRMVLGAFLGYLFYWSGNLWLPIIAHFFNNAIAVTVFYLNNDVTEKAETLGTGEGASSQVLLSVVVVSALIYLFYRISKERKLKLQPSNLIEKKDD